MSKLYAFLQRIDVFGQTISFNFRKEETYKTHLGGFTSIAMIALIISFFYSNIISFFAMTQVTTSTLSTFDISPPLLNLTQDQFMVAFRIEQTNFTTNPYFNITLEQRYRLFQVRHYKTSSNGTLTRLQTIYYDLVPCTLEHFSTIFENYGINFTDQFNQNSVSNFICPVLNKSASLLMGGAYTSPDYYFLKISVVSCKNQTKTSGSLWRPTCPSPSQIKEFVNSKGSIRFQMYSTNYVKYNQKQIINPQKSSDHVVPYLSVDQFYSFVPDQMFLQSDIFWRTSTVTTDTGIFMIPQKSAIDYGVRDQVEFRQQTSYNQLTPDYYAAFYPQRSPFSYQVSRSFQRLDNLLSYLGGFLQFVIVILGIVVKFYNYQHMIVSMANDLFEFNSTERKYGTTNVFNQLLFQTQQGRDKLKQSQKEIKGKAITDIPPLVPFQRKPQMQQSIILHKDPEKDLNLQQEISIKKNMTNKDIGQNSPQTRLSMLQVSVSKFFKEFKNLTKTSNKIGISFKFIISEILDRDDFLDDNSLLLKKATRQIQKELDIGFILKQLYELEKMKQVLFSKEQTELFNFNQKPIISFHLDKKKRRSTRLVSMFRVDEQDNQDLQKFTNLVNAYRTITALDMDQMTPEQVRFNTRLIALLGNQIPWLIESEIANVNQQQESAKSPDYPLHSEDLQSEEDNISSPK